jgi:hypothetical protein
VLSEEQLKEVEDLASLFFTEEEIEEISGIAKDTPGWRKAFRTGSLKSEAELRRSVIQLAKDGSSPAQTLAWKMMEQQKRMTN